MTPQELLAHPIVRVTWVTKSGNTTSRWAYVLPGNRRRWCSNADAEARGKVVQMAGCLARQVRENHIRQNRHGTHAGEGRLRPEETEAQRQARLTAARHRARRERKARQKAEIVSKARQWGLLPPEEPPRSPWPTVGIEDLEQPRLTSRLPDLEVIEAYA